MKSGVHKSAFFPGVFSWVKGNSIPAGMSLGYVISLHHFSSHKSVLVQTFWKEMVLGIEAEKREAP